MSEIDSDILINSGLLPWRTNSNSNRRNSYSKIDIDNNKPNTHRSKQLFRCNNNSNSINLYNLFSTIVLLNLLVLSIVCWYSLYRVNSIINNPTTIITNTIEGIDFTLSDWNIPYLLEHKWNPIILLTIHSLYSILLNNIINRIHLINNNNSNNNEIYQLAIDTSTNGEFKYIWNDRNKLSTAVNNQYERYIIDIGAMDGISGSNSYNWISNGYNGLLLEPFPRHFNRMKSNLASFITDSTDNGNNGSNNSHTVYIENSAISAIDGLQEFYLYCDASATGSSLDPNSNLITQPCNSIQINGITVHSLTNKYSIPKYFTLLTIDAEGTGLTVLKQFLTAGYRPQYIIYEISKNFLSSDSTVLLPLNYELLRYNYNNNIWRLNN